MLHPRVVVANVYLVAALERVRALGIRDPTGAVARHAGCCARSGVCDSHTLFLLGRRRTPLPCPVGVRFTDWGAIIEGLIVQVSFAISHAKWVNFWARGSELRRSLSAFFQ